MTNHEKFAKLFEFEDIGQVLVTKDTDTDSDLPQVIITVQPPDLGLCNITMSFGDPDSDGTEATEADYQKRDEAFEKLDAEAAHEAAKKFIDSIAALGGAGADSQAG